MSLCTFHQTLPDVNILQNLGAIIKIMTLWMRLYKIDYRPYVKLSPCPMGVLSQAQDSILYCTLLLVVMPP